MTFDPVFCFIMLVMLGYMISINFRLKALKPKPRAASTATRTITVKLDTTQAKAEVAGLSDAIKRVQDRFASAKIVDAKGDAA